MSDERRPTHHRGMEHSKPAAGHKADTVPDEDDRCVLEKHFLQGKSYTVIGQEMGYTGHYVSEKCRKALKKIQVPEKTS